MNKIRYLCKGCIVAPTCTKICERFTDEAVDVLFEPPEIDELNILYKELKKHKRCILCRKNSITINITTYVGNVDDKTIHTTCSFRDTLYVIKQTKDKDSLDDVYWEFHEPKLLSVFTFNKLFKDLGIET